MLKFKNVSSGYHDTTIIQDLTLNINAGEFIALLGRNGVGKTTLLRTLFGLCPMFEGAIVVEGTTLRTVRTEKIAREGFSLLPDDRGVFEKLTVDENLQLARRKGYRPEVDILELFPLLTERQNQLAGSLSGGQKQQLGIARAILAGSKFIAIDEMSQGLQPNIAHATMTALRHLVDEQEITVLIVEQSPALPVEYCGRIIGMVKGQVSLDEPVKAIQQDLDQLTDLLIVT